MTNWMTGVALAILLAPPAWLAGRMLRRRVEARRARRKESARVEHERLTSWITDTEDSGAPTLPLLRCSTGGLVVMSPAAAGLVAAGKLTSRHKTG